MGAHPMLQRARNLSFDWWSGPRALHIAVAVIGGYFLTDWVLAWASLLLILLFGMAKGESVILLSLIGLMLYPVILIWAFTEGRLSRLCTVVIGGTVFSYAFARILMAIAA
jgi:hypothetical protein